MSAGQARPGRIAHHPRGMVEYAGMVLLCLRWGFFFAAAVLLGRIILFSHSPRTLAAFAACGLGWYLLSLRKIRSLDSSSPR